MSLFKTSPYYWIDPNTQYACRNFEKYLKYVIEHPRHRRSHKQPLVFICVGTPLLAGDRLGPLIGSALTRQNIPNVYGTLNQPVHAGNIETYRQIIKKSYHNPKIIAIDAAIGTHAQEGMITIRRGALHPGSGLGKSIPPIGNIEITGIFENIESDTCIPLAETLSQIIANGIEIFIFNSSFQHVLNTK